MLNERRKQPRHINGDYMRVRDDGTGEIIGYLTEISLDGFRLETPKALEVEKDTAMRLEYATEEKDTWFIILVAKAKWVLPDPVTPFEYVQGFQIVSMEPSELEIYKNIVENYGVVKPPS